MPQEEWNKLFEAEPPRADEARTIAGMQGYIKRISDVVIADPERSPTFKRAIRTMGGRIGEARMANVDAEVKRSLVLIGEPSARAERGEREVPGAADGSVTVRAGSIGVAFDSPIGQTDWNNAMKLMPARDVTTTADLVRHLRKVGARMGADEHFRETLPSAKGWFDRFTSRMPSYARQAITCGGRTQATVQIRGNKAFGFVRGVQVGASGTDPKLVRAGNVTVADNHLSLRKPGPGIYVPMGLFVGNVETLRIQRNTLDWAGQASDDLFNHGIRVWGDIGRYLKISDNRIAVARIGIAVQPILELDRQQLSRYLWVASDNLSEASLPANVVKAPQFMLKRDNRP